VTEIILHHYPLSTFSEKVRLALGLKGLAYKHVIVPVQSPKPDQTALTGGYRRAPVVQIGADIYCDTHLIFSKLEELHPEPTLFPEGSEGQAQVISWWVERDVWMPALGFIANVNSHLYDPDFVEERRKFGYLLGKKDVEPLFNRYVQQFTAHFAWLKSILADGRPFLLGAELSAADLAAYPTVWFLQKWGATETAQWLHVEALLPWADRIAALGHGRPEEITGAEAIDIARASTPLPSDLPADSDPTGLKGGTNVRVAADDFGRDPVEGVLIGANEREVVIRRSDPRTGTVHVHFPRAGYDVVPA
jgi:glutathione S-transferase